MSEPLHRILPLAEVVIPQPGYAIISFVSKEIARLSKPGNFFEIKACLPSQKNRLFKPISLFDIEGDTIRIMLKVLGSGTQALSGLKAGDQINLIGPLGTSFPVTSAKSVLLISGGIGYPPLFFLKKSLDTNALVHWIHGGNSLGDVFPCNETWTLDGSIGNKGYPTEGLINSLKHSKFDIVYSCGPSAMLKSVAEVCKAYDTKLIVSMEEYMACGIGVCYGCSIPIGTKTEWTYKRVCKEGAVFGAEDVRWELL